MGGGFGKDVRKDEIDGEVERLGFF